VRKLSNTGLLYDIFKSLKKSSSRLATTAVAKLVVYAAKN